MTAFCLPVVKDVPTVKVRRRRHATISNFKACGKKQMIRKIIKEKKIKIPNTVERHQNNLLQNTNGLNISA